METEARRNNYEIARDRAERAFPGYDQGAMIERFRLEHDGGYLYLPFVGQRYRISRTEGRVERLTAAGPVHAGFDETMTILDVLCCGNPERGLSGEFVRVNDLDGVPRTARLGGNLFDDSARAFTGRGEALAAACRRLGGVPGTVGDVSSRIPLFDFLPVMLQFWDGDEEFGAVLKLMWDRRTLDYMRYETTYYAAGWLLRRIGEIMG